MKNGLYHKNIFMPELKLTDVPVKLSYTLHAIEASKTDRYGEIVLPDSINPSLCEIVEIEVKDNKLVKMVLRSKYSQKFDLVLVVVPDCQRVKTVWLNEVSDKHQNLERSKYISKSQAYA